MTAPQETEGVTVEVGPADFSPCKIYFRPMPADYLKRLANIEIVMNEEEAYLAKFRSLAAKKKHIGGMIAGLGLICESLKGWEKTAAHLSALDGNSLHPEWSEERLKGLLVLRSLLMDYHQEAEHLRQAWGNLTAEQKTGLADPASFA